MPRLAFWQEFFLLERLQILVVLGLVLLKRVQQILVYSSSKTLFCATKRIRQRGKRSSVASKKHAKPRKQGL
jgi:hypothetical protein